MYKKIVLKFFICIIFLVSIGGVILNHSKVETASNVIEKSIYFKREYINAGGYKKEKSNYYNVIVLGDSTIASGFLPIKFDYMTQGLTSTVNLSLTSHDATRHLNILKDFIKYNYKPDYVIWNPTAQRHLNVYLGGEYMKI